MSALLSVAIDLILFKLGSYEDMHTILDEFEFLPDQTIYCGVKAALEYLKNIPYTYNGKVMSTC